MKKEKAALPIAKKTGDAFLWRKSMRVSFAGLLLSVLSGGAAMAQLGQYAFTSAVGSTCLTQNNSVTTQPANAVFSDYSHTGSACVESISAFTTTDLNTAQAIDLNRYNTFTITPNTGYALTLSSLTFTQAVSNNGIGSGSSWVLRSSIDNYTNDLASGSSTTTVQAPVVSLPSATFTNTGAVTFRLYLINALDNITTWDNDDVSIEGFVNAYPATPGNPTSNSPQCSSPGVTLMRTGTPPPGISWYWQTSATGTFSDNSSASYTVTTSGTYYLRAQDNASLLWSNGAGSLAITVTPDVSTPVFAMGATSMRCVAGETVNYTASISNASGLTYSLDATSLAAGNTINSATGDVTYTNTWTGASIVTATAAGCNGPASATHTVTTNGQVTTPVFAAGASSVRCQGSATVTYSASASYASGVTYALDATSIAGGNTIDAATGAVTYNADWSGTTTITVAATGCSGTKSSTHTVSVTATVGTPVFTIGATSNRCQGAIKVQYAANAANTTGISYSMDAASLAGGNAIDASTGEVTYVAAWSGTTVITANAAGCNGPSVSTHSVTINSTVFAPVFAGGTSTTRCQGAGTGSYSATAANSTGISYSLDAAGLSAGNTIDASTGIVTYTASFSGSLTITATAMGCNGPVNSTLAVTTTPTVGTPVFAIGTTSGRCQGADIVQYSANATNTTAITYSLDAASLTGGNNINASTGEVAYASAWNGTTKITASAAGCNGPVTSEHTVTVSGFVGTPIFNAGSTTTRCQGAATVGYTATAVNSTGISYSLDAASLTAGNTIDASTGMVTYTASWSGTSTINATAAGCNGPQSSTHTVTVTPTVGMPVFAMGAGSTRCQGAAAVQYSATATNTTGITYSLDAISLTGGNTINAATGDVTYVAGWSGTTIITANAAGCNGPSTSKHTVTVTPTVGVPVFVIGATTTRCQGAETVTYNANASDNTGISYSLDAASISGGNSINAATAEVIYSAGWSGTSTITATASGCNGPSVSTHTVTTTATVSAPVFALGSSSARCQGAGTVTYTASAAKSTGITYALDFASRSAGNTINTSTGAVTFVATWGGTSTITATATGCNGPKTATHTVTVTPTVGTPVFTLGSSSTRCYGAGVVKYSATASSSTGITYSLDVSSLAGGNTINASTGDVTYIAAWTGTTSITATASGCNGPTSSVHTVTINGPVITPVFAAGSSSARCQGAGTVTYSSTASSSTGITYSLDAASLAAGNGINTSTGVVSYTAGWNGTTTITASAAGCGGPATAIHTVTVSGFVGTPVFNSGSVSTRCQGAATVNYSAVAANSSGITYSLNAASRIAGNTINASTGDVTFVSGYIGTSTITATAAGCNGPKTSTHNVTVTADIGSPVFTSGSSSGFCQGARTVTYQATSVNSTGIIYSLDQASINGGNLINANSGTVNYDASWSGTTIITASAQGCGGPKTATYTVTITPTVSAPVFSFGPASARCQGAGTVRYTATAANATKIVYKLDNTTYNFGTNDYDPNTGDVYFDAAWNGTSYITATATGCNGPVSSVHTITVTPTVGTPVFAFGSSSSRCQGAGTTNYSATANNSTAITYTLDAASIAAGNSIIASTGDVTFIAGWLGNSTIKATATGCNGTKSANHTITSTPSVTTPVFTSGLSSARCQAAGTVTYIATASNTSGISYSLDAASAAAGNFIKPNGQLTYLSTWSGTTVITASAAGCNGPATATHTVTVTPVVSAPVFASGSSSTRCQASGIFTYSATASNSTGITYSLDAASITGGNSINGSTGAVTFIAGWSGSSTITASAAGCSGPVTSTHNVTTTSTVGTPVFSLGSSSGRCQASGSVTYSASSANSTGITYSLDAASIAGGNSINASTGTVTFTAAWTGSSTITAGATGCNGPKTAQHTVTINQSVTTPVFSGGVSSTRCQSAGSVTYAASATNTSGITYSLDASSIAGGNSINASTGAVTYASSWNGTVVITASAAGCNGPKTAQHTVTITPDGTPNFVSGSSSTRCQAAGNVTYTASGSNNSGVTYSLDNASIGGGNTINTSTGVVTYAIGWYGTSQITSTATGCNGVKTAIHSVTTTPNGAPVFTMGDVSSRLQAAGTVRYSATSNNSGTITYSLDAASISGGNTINSATGDVTYVASWGSQTIITAKVSGCNGVVSSTHTVTMNSLIVTKQLYLSDPSQALDRIDPVATNDLTTVTSATLGTAGTTGTITIDNNASSSATGTSLTISNFVTGSGTNRFMLVSVACDAAVTSVNYAGQSLTLVSSAGTTRPRVEIWQLLKPPSGTGNVTITTANNGSIKAGVSTFSGVDPTTPIRLPVSAASGNSTPSITLASAANELVYDVAGISNDPTATPSTGQTQQWNIKGVSNMTGCSSNKPGAASVNMSWATSTNPNPWAQIALSIRPALTAITGTTFTQSPVLCLPLIIKANNNIVVSNYVSVISGTMSVTPNLTAVLRYGSTVIVTLKNPSYNSTTGLVTWTGSLASDVTVPSGQAVSLDVSTAQAGVTFSINYDSKTQPSKIDLPVSTYINIQDLQVFTAAYPAGSAVISGIAGSFKYIRATVTDPFGSSDINGVDINFNPVGGIKTATAVASTGCSQTYETVWNTSGASGSYNISATAKEGYENKVTSVKNTSFYFCTTCPPVAVADSGIGSGGTPLLLDVLANDYDPNNNINTSSLNIVSQPQNGSALLSGGKIVYLPNGNFSGNDTLTYQICDRTSPTPLCGTGSVFLKVDPTIIDPCSDAAKNHVYYVPYPEQDARTALLASQNVTNVLNNIRSIISLKMPYPNMTIVWDQWEDGYEANILNPQQSTTLIWGDGNPYNGIAPGYQNDIIPAGGSIVLDNTMPVNPRVKANLFYDGRDKIFSSGQITMTQALGDPSFFQGTQTYFSVQAMKTNITSTADFGTSFTIPAGENFNSRDFRYSALFIRASTNNTIINIDKDNDGAFDLTDTLQEGESLLVNGGVMNGATVTGSAPIGIDLHFAGVDGGANGWSSRDVPIFPATWYSNVYYTPVPTVRSPDSSVVMLYNSLNRPIKINWYSGAPANGVVTLPAKTVVRFPLALSATAAYKFVNLTGEAFTAIEIVDSYTPGSTAGNNGTYYDWSFNMISEQRLTTYATIAWAPGSTDGSGNYNPIWVTPANNTTIYVKYNGDVLNGGSISPSGMHYDVSYTLNALTYKKIFDATDKDQSGIAIYTCDGTKIAAVYGEDPSTSTPISTPGWDIGSTIQPFCALKLILANDDYAYTMTNRPVTIDVLKNDGGFLSQVDKSTVIAEGYLQPKHGTVSVNSNGTLLYTPVAGYTGLDTLEYNVCSTPSPVVCDVAMVIIKIDACPTPANRNIISGQVFIDKNKDGINNDGGVGFPNAKVYLYADGNCNGAISANELKDSVIVDSSGTYQFLMYPEKTVEDDFDGTGGTNTCASGSDGTDAWLSNWTDAGDQSIGFCVSPAQSYSNTDVEIVKDGTFGYALRLKDNDVSAIRRVNLNGATAAYLSFSYRRAVTSLSTGSDILVQASTNGTAWNTVFTISGDGKSDAAYVNVYNQNILPYASSNTYIRFLTNSNLKDPDEVFIDNISITYLKYPQCYITKVDPAAVVPYFQFTTASQNAVTATSGGTCMFPFDYGIVKNSITISGNLYNDANGLTDNTINGTGIGSPSGIPVFAYLADSAGKVAFKTVVNTTTGAYSFPLADVMVNYTVVLSTSDSQLYHFAPPAVNLPAGWVSTGDAYGTINGAGSGNKTGAATSSITVKTAFANITGVNFGIEQLPVAGSGINTAIDKGGTNSVVVPANTFTNTIAGSDVLPGTITSIRITVFPDKVTTMTINGTPYNASNFPLSGVFIPASTTGQPAQTITLDPVDGFVKVTIPFYTIDNAGKESKSTGTAVMRFLPDTDKDGVADLYDIDDDNDGITDYVELCGNGATSFSCMPNGSDPSDDNDDDGIVNFRDADYGPLNAAGCLAAIDKDGDGIPDYLDLDSDNDGIPDVVEAFGTDANGDGIIDNFTDTDGDGLSQNLDANNTGAAGSGQGLGFKDFDGDGVANSVDLDSDNDGIPDLVEAGGADPNNDGRVSSFTDVNGNGLNDANETGGALLITGTDTNNDGRPDSYPNKNADQTGYPNPYDLDSDGDGVTDVVEAGFPGSIVYANGVVTGVYTNGWSNTVQALASLNLANTDGRGPANYLDIDSDDDGISDNIEAQSTGAYKVPTDTDADNDGLADTYDSNTSAFGGSGISLNDQDLDGIPDMLDTDTDNDGKADLNEASKNGSLTQATINAADTDGDGLLDEFDLLNVNTLAAGLRYQNVTDSKMGANGSFTGPATSGSNVTLIRTYASDADRDWRNYNILQLGDLLWYDFNNNGLYDNGETRISGAVINLYADANGDNVPDGAVVVSTTTDASGNFQFSELSKTKYIAAVVLPTGYTIGTAIASSANPNNGTDNDNNGINLVGSEVRTNYINLTAANYTLDIGLKGTGSIGDFVFNDLNGDGIQNTGETGIANAKVSLTYPNGYVTTTTTNSSGIYIFNGLGDGTYPLTFTTPPGYFASPAAQGSDVTKNSDPVSGNVLVTITAAQVRTDIDAGFYLPYTLGNAVWYDFNNNGRKDVNEPPIANATVKLYNDANTDNIPDGAAIATVTTDASGNYGFPGLQSGSYIVGVTRPAGYTIGFNISSGNTPNNYIDDDNNGVNLVSGEVRTNFITLSGSNSTLDIGLKGTGSIGDFVFNDVNGNGIQEPTEKGIAGVTVKLVSQGGATYTVTSSASGSYSFKGLIAGIYTVSFTTPSGYLASASLQGTDRSVDSDPINGTTTITLATGEFNSDIDAGFYQPFTLGDQVWLDVNNNGLKESGESGIAGITVSLYNDNNTDDLPDGAAIATTVTNASGIYQFPGLAAGNYIVSVTLPSAYQAGTTTATSATPANNIDNDNNGVKTAGNEIRTNSIAVNASNTTIDFALKGTASIGDFVWLDANGNGVQDAGERGIPGVTVTLTSSGGVSSSTVTDNNGNYVFGSLIPGTYTVHFTTPNVPNAPVTIPYIPRKANQSGNTAKDSDPNPATGDVTIVVATGQVNTGVDAGFAEDQDNDNDGIANSDEDGGYEPYNDCDGDGTPNCLDPSPGCPLAPGTDLFGNAFKPLVWKDANSDGINDFFDFDLDGILNELDLDSDNDGISDLKEAQDKRAVDANNDGMVDGTDNDGDGILSSADQNDNLYGDEALIVTDMDLDGKPGFLDLDSDGDGIVDAVEAGFPASVVVSNGRVTGPSTNGWANSVKSLGNFTLRNTDGRGQPDYADIDSDDDGITDNIEGQSTGSYLVPDMTDTDGDGLVDTYDVAFNSFGGGGITPYDHDGDGTPDYMDLDTDNDKALDINEASRNFALTASNININDADGDGLVDQFDNLNINSLSAVDRYKNVTNSQMGNQGSYNGPLPSGSLVKLTGIPSGTDRDWRATYILPLQIVSFTGTYQDNVARLTWKVENEQEVDHYEVERSKDAVVFDNVAALKAKNSSSSVYNHQDDATGFAGSTVYYRIKQVDKNGTVYYSKVISFKKNATVLLVKVYPNPVRNLLMLKMYSETKQTGKVTIYDAAGKAVFQRSLALERGDNVFEIDEVRSLAKGWYMAVINMQNDVYVQKLVKE